MKDFVNILLIIVKILALSIAVPFSAFGIYEQIVGPVNAEKLLQKLHIPLNYTQTIIIGFVSVVIIIIVHILVEKLSSKL